MVKYYEYLASREWALKKRAVRERSEGVCERCKKAGQTETHHLTYERLGNERLEDLLGVCKPCHQFLSAKSDHDPAVVYQREPVPTEDMGIIAAFMDKILHLPRDPESMGRLNSQFLDAIRVAKPPTALELAELMRQANRKFLERRGVIR